MKEKINNDLSYIKAGYRSDKWKWVLSLPHAGASVRKSEVKTAKVPPAEVSSAAEGAQSSAEGDHHSTPENCSDTSKETQNNDALRASASVKPFTEDQVEKEHVMKVYGFDKFPKHLPCQKRCSSVWCLADLKGGVEKDKVRPVDQPRESNKPVGLQNTANTCWINSALQALFHLPIFRNVINSVDGFTAEESLSSLLYLLQAMFVEMETHANRAIACRPGSVFEKIGLFATQEIMRKDTDHEVLKCVSEFLENTIDNLIADPKLSSELQPLFNISLMRVARWKCPVCERTHENQLVPATSYTMAAYVSADECPLDQCLVDLQTETQTGVSLVCGDSTTTTGGCGAMVKADRIVTPKIESLPTILVIRNNSLMDRDLKRRLHVVYPETLDLTSHTLSHVAASYSLSAVIFHHGHWVKHFSAHVKTSTNKWYNFNDEVVSELTNRTTTGNPSESHRNYFSMANVSQKYKHRPGLRVSRGAFVWVYVRNGSQEYPDVVVPPPDQVVQYVLQKQEENMNVNHQLQAEMKTEKESLLNQMAVCDVAEEHLLISEPLLSAWYNDDSLNYTPQPAILAQALCEHKLFSPLKFYMLKCVRSDGVKTLLNHRFGIHQDESVLKLGLPLLLPPEHGCCKTCLVKYVNHIIFIEKIKNIHKQVKKEARKQHEGPTQVIGQETLEFWPRLALSAYVKEHGIDEVVEPENVAESSKKTDDDQMASSSSSDNKSESVHVNGDRSDKPETESEPKEDISTSDTSKLVPEPDSTSACDAKTKPVKDVVQTDSPFPDGKSAEAKDSTVEYMLFNEDIVCQHNLLSPMVTSYKIPKELAEELMQLCSDSVHPAIYQDDFVSCNECGTLLEASVQACDIGRQQKKELSNLFQEKKRPHPMRDPGKQFYLIAREFFTEWKSYIRSCERGGAVLSAPTGIINAPLLCSHNHLLFPVYALQPHELTEHLVMVWEEEWKVLHDRYPPDHVISASYTDGGILVTEPGVCENGCVEVRAAQDYEDQFTYENEIIHVRQVNSVGDIPRRPGRGRGLLAATTNENTGARKKPRLASLGAGAPNIAKRLVRASKTFSSTDTIREVQNFIAERTGIWPMLQTVWVCGEEQEGGEGEPLQLTDDHRAMTLGALRVRPGDTIYFRAAVEDLEKASGDGVVEFNEMDDDDN